MINTNEQKVFAALQSQWPWPVNRSRLVKLTKMPSSTILDCLQRLELEGQVVSFPLRISRRGRPSTFYFSVDLKLEEQRLWRNFAQGIVQNPREDEP